MDAALIAERFAVPATSTSRTPAARQCQTSRARDDQRLYGGCSGGGPLVFKANEQIRRKPRELPEHEQGQDVVAENDAEHRPHEREQRGVEAARLGVTIEVTAGIENNERTDAGNQRREQQPETIEVERQRQSERRRPRQLDQAAAAGARSQTIRLPKSTASRAGHIASNPARRGNRLTSHAARSATTKGREDEADHSGDAIVDSARSESDFSAELRLCSEECARHTPEHPYPCRKHDGPRPTSDSNARHTGNPVLAPEGKQRMPIG